MIHSAFKGIVVTFSGHFNAQTATQGHIDMNIKCNLFAGFTFKSFFESRRLRFTKRFRRNNFDWNNAVFIVVTRYIFCPTGGHFTKRATLTKQFHEIQQIRMDSTAKRAIQQSQTLGFCNGLILDQTHIIRVVGKQFANFIQLSKQLIFKLLIFG